jgi:hypothetical protein
VAHSYLFQLPLLPHFPKHRFAFVTRHWAHTLAERERERLTNDLIGRNYNFMTFVLLNGIGQSDFDHKEDRLLSNICCRPQSPLEKFISHRQLPLLLPISSSWEGEGGSSGIYHEVAHDLNFGRSTELLARHNSQKLVGLSPASECSSVLIWWNNREGAARA